MSAEVITKEDLQEFRVQLLQDFKGIVEAERARSQNNGIEAYRTKDVRRILGCSINKLVSLRVGRKIRWKKIGGTVYYNREDVRRLLEEGYW